MLEDLRHRNERQDCCGSGGLQMKSYILCQQLLRYILRKQSFCRLLIHSGVVFGCDLRQGN